MWAASTWAQAPSPPMCVFAPDGQHAYAMAWGVSKVMELAVDGEKVTLTGQDVATGAQRLMARWSRLTATG